MFTIFLRQPHSVEKVTALAWIRRPDSHGIDGQNQWNKQISIICNYMISLVNSVLNGLSEKDLWNFFEKSR